MKKVSMVLGLLFTVGVFLLTGCEKNADQPADRTTEDVSNIDSDVYYNTFNDFESSFTNIEKQTANVIVKSGDKYAGNLYTIYDNDGHLLDKGFHDWRGSFDITQTANLVTLEYGFGGTNVQPKYRLYDVENSKVSRYFEGPIAVYDELIAYFKVGDNGATLVVQDAFDVEKYRVSFSGKFDQYVRMKLLEIAFSEDGKTVKIKHCETNNEANVIEEQFVLND